MRWSSESEEKKLMNDVIRAAHDVRAVLGGRFTPDVYREALKLELEQRALRVAKRPALCVKYRGHIVGEFKPDLLVADCLLVELDAAPELPRHRIHDVGHAMAAARLPGAVVLNFGARKLQYQRLHAA
jgi:GxxExxY protein